MFCTSPCTNWWVACLPKLLWEELWNIELQQCLSIAVPWLPTPNRCVLHRFLRLCTLCKLHKHRTGNSIFWELYFGSYCMYMYMHSSLATGIYVYMHSPDFKPCYVCTVPFYVLTTSSGSGS